MPFTFTRPKPLDFKTMTEQEVNAEVERYLDYVQGCVVDSFNCDEIMGALEAGFDVVATVGTKRMLASDPIMTCSIVGEAERFALDYHKRTGISVVFIPCGLQGNLTWHVTNWTGE
jgi:hypothetical protein